VPSEPDFQPLILSGPRQERILERLSLIGPGPAAFYRDALRLLGAPRPLACSTHLVGHCFREIESALQDVLLPDGLSSEEAKLGGKKLDSHKRKVRAILASLRIAESDDLAKLWLRIATREDEAGLHRAAHRDALESPRPLEAEFRAWTSELEALLDLLLDRFVAQFANHMRLVDDLARTVSPTPCDVQRLRQSIPNNQITLSRFFAQIDARWVVPLRDAGLFVHLPATEGAAGDAPRFAAWPASSYLARVASTASASELQIIGEVSLTIPDTDNPWVNRDLAKVALAVPTEVAEALGQRLCSKLRGAALGFADDLAALAERLADDGRTPAALDLTRALLAVEVEGDEA
jgi:hypothetical protein